MPIDKVTKNLVFSICIDLISIIPIVCSIILIDKSNVLERGYFPDDQSIMYPYYPDTIPPLLVFAVGVPVTILTNLIKIYQILFAFVVGYLLTLFLTVIGKITVGRLRPHFLDLCIPKVLNKINDYVTNFTCARTMKPNREELELQSLFGDMRKSFPSGHSSVSMYNSIFLVVYIGKRFPSRRMFRGLAILFQASVMAFGFLVCYSRIMDNKHHWSDVLAGAILGTILAIIVPLIFTKRYYELIEKEIIIQETKQKDIEAQNKSEPKLKTMNSSSSKV